MLVQLFQNKILHLDINTLSAAAIECIRVYFLEVNIANSAISSNLMMIDKSKLEGEQFLWSIAIKVRCSGPLLRVVPRRCDRP